MSERIFGRARELAVVRRALDDTAAGAGGCHVVLGPPGIGKSRLLRAAGDLADERNVAIAAREAFRHDLAAPLVTLAGALRHCSPPTGDFAWLAQATGADGNYVKLERLRDSLERYAAKQPLLIVVDDAHWMDELSALAVRELVPALASSPVRWLFAGRAQPGATPGWQTLEWLVRGGTEPITLDILDDDATAELCGDVVGAEVDNTVLALVAGCGGNPLRIEQLMNALDRTDQLLVSEGTATVVGSELPSSFVDTVQEILASLSADARWLLRSTSVLARPFGLPAAARLMGRDPSELFPLFDEVTAAGVLGDADGFTYRHDLVRQAVRSTLGKTMAEHLHREAAAIARDERRPASEVADHLLASGRAGTEAAIGMLRAAAEEVSGSAPATAADLMLHALSALGRHDPDRPALIAETVGLLASAARVAEARELGEQALNAGLDPRTEAKLLLGLAEAFKHAGQNRNAVRFADRGLRHAEITEAVRARLHAIRAHAEFYLDDLAEADASGDEAAKLGRDGGEPGAAVFGLTARSLVAQAEGRLTDAYDHAATATDLADRSGGAARHRHPRIWLGSALTGLDRFDEAEEQLGRGRAESERLGTAWAQPLWHYYYAWLLTARGRLDEAAAEADAGVATAEQLTAYQLAVPLLGALVRLAVRRGDLASADAYRERMRQLMDTGITAAPEDVVWAEAVLLDAHGDRAAAFAKLTLVYDALPGRPALLAQEPAAGASLMDLALAVGDRRRANLVADAARTYADRNPGSHTAAGVAAHAAGLLHDDIASLRTAIDEFRRTPRPLALASALADAAIAGRDRVDHPTVQAWYDEALSLMTTYGARRAYARLADRLGAWRGTTVVSAPAPAPCLPQLSEAERRVALLVAGGMTNIQVAGQLFLSRHTVDSHLRKIFQKLDIRRRVELALVVARECSPNREST